MGIDRLPIFESTLNDLGSTIGSLHGQIVASIGTCTGRCLNQHHSARSASHRGGEEPDSAVGIDDGCLAQIDIGTRPRYGLNQQFGSRWRRLEERASRHLKAMPRNNLVHHRVHAVGDAHAKPKDLAARVAPRGRFVVTEANPQRDLVGSGSRNNRQHLIDQRMRHRARLGEHKIVRAPRPEPNAPRWIDRKAHGGAIPPRLNRCTNGDNGLIDFGGTSQGFAHHVGFERKLSLRLDVLPIAATASALPRLARRLNAAW